MQVHVGTVEQRVALADDGDEATLVQMGGEVARRGVVEGANDVAIRRFIPRQLGRHREDQR